MIKLALSMTARDWRAGQLRFLLIALTVAVAALSATGFFVDRLRSGLDRDAHQLLGADVVVSTDLPVRPEWRAEALRRGLVVTDTVVFPSMATAGEGEQSQSLLASLKAVGPGYPLRGRLKLTTDAAQAEQSEGAGADGIPAPGTVWLDAGLLGSLGTSVGGQVKLGDKTFTVAQLIASEPDRGANFLAFAPRVMLALADLEATNLIQPGSRVTYRLLVAAPPSSKNSAAEAAAFQQWMQDTIKQANLKGVRVESLENGRPEMRNTLDRADRFLSLVGLLSAMLAAVAVAMAARRFMQRHLDACAMLRCLGLTQNQVTAMYLYEFLLVGLVGSTLGVAVGFGAHYVLLEVLGKLVAADLPGPTIWPALQGLATGILLLAAFALPPILQLRKVPHNRVIRREQDAPQVAALATYGLGFAGFASLLLWQAGDAMLALYTALGFVAAFGVFALVAWLGLKALKPLRGAIDHQSWRFAITSLQRRPGATIVQVVSLALGMMALLVLTVVREDLMTAWRNATPPDAPNRFVINVMPDQSTAFQKSLRDAGVSKFDWYPMIRGRLVAVNGKPVSPDDYVEDRAKRLVDREFNLSNSVQAPPHNTVVAGEWKPDAPGEVSVEEGLAETLGLKLGDTMRFDIGGMQNDARITSLRKVDWGSLHANFFVMYTVAALPDVPVTYMGAFRAPETRGFDNALVRSYPNVTNVDMSATINQVQRVLDQVIRAVEFLFGFTLAAGLVVLFAAVTATREERAREFAVMRAVGARASLLRQVQRAELAGVGLLAGFLASIVASVIGWGLARYVFDFTWTASPVVPVAGALAGAVLALAAGWWGLRDVLRRPVVDTLRRAAE